MLLGIIQTAHRNTGYKMPVDPSIFNNIHTFQDYNIANQDFLAKQKAAQLDAASKSNILATQVLSGATDQPTYEAAKQQLSSLGVDTSQYAPDFATGTQQAQQARLAQSPLGTLLNAGLKSQSNQIALGGLTGQVPAGAENPLGALGVGGVTIAPQATITRNSPTPPVGPSFAEAMAPRQPQAPVESLDGVLAQAQSGLPPKNPGEAQAAYQSRLSMEPSVIRSKAAAEKGGQLEATDQEAALKAQELTDRLAQNLAAMKQLNASVPSSGLIGQGTKVLASQALKANGLGDGVGASASQQWDKINNQQVISEIQQFLASGGANTRINQTLDKIMRKASEINSSDQPESRGAQIDAALAELGNKNISQQNVVAKQTGQPTQDYQPIPIQTSTIPNGTIADGPNGAKLVRVDGKWKPM